MASKIVPLIPKHTVYVEPFAGGLAVFFAKPWPDVTNTHHYREVINDTDSRIVNFYKQLRDNPDELVRRCMMTPYSFQEHSCVARKKTDDLIENARRWYVDIQQSFSNKSRGGWRTSVFGRNQAATWFSRMGDLGPCASRLLSVHMENRDAIEVIQKWDSPQTFFYCDPPYPGADQGHYSGYSRKDFNELVEVLGFCQGSFVLSCYGFEAPQDWEMFDFTAHCSASCQGVTRSKRGGVDRGKAGDNLGERKRTEVVYRVIRGQNVRPEIQKLYDSGKFDCFQGKTPGSEPEQISLLDLVGDLG